ncbi:polysaccharide biosynthesis tyrosine autokinase [Streptomyces violascens]|uniref:polysaccharide biosynthesis tyrosine autokinase n=1 Tax=Streptomyces violascens TaxID=67381 RepID=UPI003695A2F1
MELRRIIKALGRSWPVVAVCALLGLGAGWLATAMTTPLYQAHTQLFVSASVGSATTELNQGSSFSLARVQSYVAIAASSEITEPVHRELHLPGTPAQLASRIDAEAPPGTVLVNITVSDTRPQRAALIANAVALRFRDVVQRLETPDAASKPPVKLDVIQKASAPAQPVSPKPALDLMAGLLAGLLLGAGAAVLREALDTTLNTPEALTELTALPVLASIPFDREAPQHPGVDGHQAHSARAEAFRLLRANLRFAEIDERPRILIVTSPVPRDGKTNTALNLALSMAGAGTPTVLVDADLRRPSVAETCGLVQEAGLTNVLIGKADLVDVMQQTAGSLAVLTSGPVPPNPAELLASARMGEVLRELAESYEAVIVDTTPLLPVADTVGLAQHGQAVLLVVRAGKTPRDRVIEAADSLRMVGVRTLGTVLSMVPAPHQAYGHGEPSGKRSASSPRPRVSAPVVAGGDTQ